MSTGEGAKPRRRKARKARKPQGPKLPEQDPLATPPPPKSPVGRPIEFTWDLALEICGRIAEGEPLTKICRSSKDILKEAAQAMDGLPVLPVNEMPAYSTVMRWLLMSDKPWHKAFREMYEFARDCQADHMVDELISIPEDPIIRDSEGKPIITPFGVAMLSSGHIKNKLDARKWVAAKLKPRKYSDRQVIEHAGNAENPLKIQDERILFETMLKNPAAAAAAESLLSALGTKAVKKDEGKK